MGRLTVPEAVRLISDLANSPIALEFGAGGLFIPLTLVYYPLCNLLSVQISYAGQHSPSVSSLPLRPHGKSTGSPQSMSSVLDGPAGFALRTNGSCLDTEVDCGATVHPFRACCPGGSYCPSQYNVNCCPSAANCTQLLVETPKCANETWDLYNYYGYFCCEKGTTAFGTNSGSDGCAVRGYNFDSSETLLPVVSSGKASVAASTSSVTSTPSTSSTSSTSPTHTSTQTQPSEASSKTNTGAIAGGVVGGVAGVALIAFLVWWLLSRRTKRQPVLHGPQVDPVTDHKGNRLMVSELDGGSTAHELEDRVNHPAHELPADSTVR
ncbi:hypothetical protein Asppvi_000797 [Aspergillus pseudoviridinutans]|uniref:Mid2 domain-containing protein n=1 Tax=Aspergillus pseudoviridinutans TaxID=1517512 RepID=A0A9P3B1B9_9EURO|nr:uncharacterized protein Asppvi_000797 [Aspergillus pseudoviridinutans]GIJ82291.1 hypothetical protein Asppvi_000797 [Aspergillus pseudoviridinutans]